MTNPQAQALLVGRWPNHHAAAHEVAEELIHAKATALQILEAFAVWESQELLRHQARMRESRDCTEAARKLLDQVDFR